jgi:hypothetical protein
LDFNNFDDNYLHYLPFASPQLPGTPPCPQRPALANYQEPPHQILLDAPAIQPADGHESPPPTQGDTAPAPKSKSETKDLLKVANVCGADSASRAVVDTNHLSTARIQEPQDCDKDEYKYRCTLASPLNADGDGRECYIIDHRGDLHDDGESGLFIGIQFSGDDAFASPELLSSPPAVQNVPVHDGCGGGKSAAKSSFSSRGPRSLVEGRGPGERGKALSRLYKSTASCQVVLRKCQNTFSKCQTKVQLQ